MSWRTIYDGVTYDLPYRDSQRKKCYDAEHVCFSKHRYSKQLRNLTEAQLQLLVDSMFESDFMRQLLVKCGRNPEQEAPRIKLIGRRAFARGSSFEVSLPPWAKNIHTLLHEVAHGVAPMGAKHGWAFCAVMVEMVREYFGPEWAERLCQSYIRHGAKFTPNSQHRVKSSLMAADRR